MTPFVRKLRQILFLEKQGMTILDQKMKETLGLFFKKEDKQEVKIETKAEIKTEVPKKVEEPKKEEIDKTPKKVKKE